jgi:hypothetical protein
MQSMRKEGATLRAIAAELAQDYGIRRWTRRPAAHATESCDALPLTPSP